jgi:ATP-dependent Clp protease ATP-binding subunit ClpX
MFKRNLACSFCRRPEAEVAKLVAGPNVYICDRCAKEAIRIMDSSMNSQAAGAPDKRRLFRRVVDSIGWFTRGDSARIAAYPPRVAAD